MIYNISVVYDCMKIRIYIYNFIYKFKFGGGFGYFVCVVDVNGDSYDDVLIGVLFEYINELNRNIVIDSGVVYMYFGIGMFVSYFVLINYFKYEC